MTCRYFEAVRVYCIFTNDVKKLPVNALVGANKKFDSTGLSENYEYRKMYDFIRLIQKQCRLFNHNS